MRTYLSGLLTVLITALMLGGCAKKEVIKAEEPKVPVAAPTPEAKPPASLPVPQPVPSVPQKAEVAQEPVAAAEAQKAVPDETVRKVQLETIYFDFDKSELRERDRAILTANAGIIMDKLKENVRIEGHCDERGSAEYNLALGERRAGSAMRYLVTLGVPEERLSIVSYGKEKPLDPGHTEDAWAKNRRAQFVIMGK